MNSRGHQRRQRRLYHFTALAGDSENARDERLRCRRSKAYDNFRTDASYLRLQPGAAGCDFLGVRFFVNPEFAARGRIEMFDDVGDIDVLAINSRLCEGEIE